MATKFGRFTPKTKQAPVDNATRFESASDATRELHEQFNDWSAAVSKYGQQLALALIAANWAIFGTRAAILLNPFSRWSIAVAVFYLGANLAGAAWITHQFDRRKIYADDDVGRWKRQYQASIGKRTNWPYTAAIDRFGGRMRVVHTIAPILSGILLLISIIFPVDARVGPKPPGPSSPPSPCTPTAVDAPVAGPQHIASITGFVSGSANQVDGGESILRMEVGRAADSWIAKRKSGQHGLLLIVGSTDRVRLTQPRKAQFDANIGLAQARAEEVKSQLMSAISKNDSQASPTGDEVLVLASGPRHSPVACSGCTSIPEYPGDRRVDIWVIWSAKSTASTCPPAVN